MLRTLIGSIRPAVSLNTPALFHSSPLRALAATPKKSIPIKTLSVAEKLKQEERRRFIHERRQRSDYKDNMSAALALPFSDKFLATQSKSKALELSEKHVIEHANRRVDLFFYTLVAYYKTGITPIIGHTDLQHGIGRVIKPDHLLTQGCHSSFIPSPLDKTIYNSVRCKSILSGTHFLDSLNATVELPPSVNHFDDLLENLCRQSCADILAEVAKGSINPIEGLNRFLKMMHDVLTDLKRAAEHQNSYLLLRYSWIARRELNLKIVNLVARGTLRTTFDEERLVARDAYIQLLLRMTPEEIESCDDKNKDELYLEKIAEIKDEILSTKSNGMEW